MTKASVKRSATARSEARQATARLRCCVRPGTAIRPTGPASGLRRSATMLPSLISMTRSARAATEASWVTMITVLRSEEHTSELQSLMRISYAVFCLKKKKKTTKDKKTTYHSTESQTTPTKHHKK